MVSNQEKSNRPKAKECGYFLQLMKLGRTGLSPDNGRQGIR